MLSVRLNPEVEKILNFLSFDSGLSKNQIISKALEQYIQQSELGAIPLETKITEASHDTYMHMLDLKKDKLKNAALVVEMAKRSGIGVWSARHDLANSGDPCPAIYGRNIVYGYSWSESDEIFVVSKNIPHSPTNGASSYEYNITSFSDWQNYMELYPVKQLNHSS